MGYHTRRTTEYLSVLQKLPKKAKVAWKLHGIPDTWREKIVRKTHAYTKPIMLQSKLICAVSEIGDYVIDPAAGSFSVLEAATECNRNFLGCDLVV